MRIVSYNILDGGEGRADPLAEVLEAQKPDVVALVEADRIEVVDRIARRMGMDSIRAEGSGMHTVALLSRWAIVDSVNHAALRGVPRCLLEATLLDPQGNRWSIGVAHFHPRAGEEDETIREQEAQALLEVFAPHRAAQRPHVLAGDFNANAPIQRINPMRCKRSTREAWERNGGYIPRRVVQMLLEAGYIDVLEAVHGDRAGDMASFTTEHPGQRVDYIFAFGLEPSRIRRAWIEHDRLARYASDHYPVGAELV